MTRSSMGARLRSWRPRVEQHRRGGRAPRPPPWTSPARVAFARARAPAWEAVRPVRAPRRRPARRAPPRRPASGTPPAPVLQAPPGAAKPVGGSWWNRIRAGGCCTATFAAARGTGRGVRVCSRLAWATDATARRRTRIRRRGRCGGRRCGAARRRRRLRDRRRALPRRSRGAGASALAVSSSRATGAARRVLARPVDARQQRRRNHRGNACRQKHGQRRTDDRAMPLRSRAAAAACDCGAAKRRRSTAGRVASMNTLRRRDHGGARRQHHTQRRRESRERRDRRCGHRRDDRVARKAPSCRERRRHVRLREPRGRQRHQRRVRPGLRPVAVVRVAQREDQVLARRRRALRRPARRRVVEPVLATAGSAAASRRGCTRRSASRARASAAGRRGGPLRAHAAAAATGSRSPFCHPIGSAVASALARNEREREVDERERVEARVSLPLAARRDRTSAARTGMQTLSPLMSRCTTDSSWIASTARAGSGARAPTSARSPRTRAAARGRRARPAGWSPTGRPWRRRRTSARAACRLARRGRTARLRERSRCRDR